MQVLGFRYRVTDSRESENADLKERRESGYPGPGPAGRQTKSGDRQQAPAADCKLLTDN